MKKFIGTLLILFSTILYISGQSAEIALREYYIDAEFFFAQEYFADALHDYLEIYKRGYKDNANINYKIGKCYLSIQGKKDRAIEYLEKAKTSASSKYKGAGMTENIAPLDVYLYLGNAYRVNNMLDKAIESYNKYKTLIPSSEVNLQEYADKEIEACNIANEFMSHPKDVEFQNLGDAINSNNDDYKAVVSGDGNTIFFMHKLPFYDAVSVSRIINGKWSRPENITPQILSDGNQFVSSVSYDGNYLILTKEDEFNSDIYFSKFVDNRWTPSEPIKGGDINTKYWESHASISSDGKVLYFTSNRKGGIGEMDIYVSKLLENGTWGPAKNIGAKINTILNEDTPFITEDGNTLFFSSQGFVNMGGYDLFYSHNENDTAWSVPENLGYPYSTTDDDLFFYPSENGKIGYTSRIRPDGFGSMDIYKVGEKVIPAEPIAELLTVPTEQKPSLQNIDTTVQPATHEEIKQPEPVEEKPAAPVIKTFEITPLLFGFDKSTLTQEGKIELNKIISLMNDNQNLEIVFTGFADALGPEDYNIQLSEKRAMQTLSYFIEKGIKAKRLKAVGKGETEFIAPNTKDDGSDFPEGREFNRRVEFQVIGVDSNTLIINRIDPVPDVIKSHAK
jgi:outer membrane protein OmpA-like peptidoglycan-associated protein/tetratricopeptide (TPR) repeat protein